MDVSITYKQKSRAREHRAVGDYVPPAECEMFSGSKGYKADSSLLPLGWPSRS